MLNIGLLDVDREQTNQLSIACIASLCESSRITGEGGKRRWGESSKVLLPYFRRQGGPAVAASSYRIRMKQKRHGVAGQDQNGIPA